MDIAKLFGSIEDQDKGKELNLLHPVTGEPTGMKLVIAGPDSRIQKDARFELADELRKISSYARGKLSAEDHDRLVVGMLAKCIISWEITENGKGLELKHVNAVRLLMAGTWVREQVDEFAASRALYYTGDEASEEWII